MRFEDYLTENIDTLNALASDMEGDSVDTLEKKMRVLAAINIFVGVCFDRRDMLQRGLAGLQDSNESL